MGLREYRRKRNFSRTAEPEGGENRESRGHLYVIQKHAASSLHYDFRLELEGVLKSWAVPKGPSLDPAEKRLAVHVEDHPLDYGSFEGVIPEGQYGGGTVLLWDRGRWSPEGDASEGYRKGRIRFRLEGEKLHGSWSLVRMGRGGKNWLLIKSRDEEARPGDGEITDTLTESVASGRELEEIASGRGRDREKKHVARARSASRKANDPAKRKAPAQGPGSLKETEVGGVRLSSPDKVLYAGQGITKLDLARHYERVAGRLLPHVEGRPLMLVRCPAGPGKKCFVQRHAGRSVGETVRRISLQDKGKTVEHVAIDGLEGLIGLAQMGTLEVHHWGAFPDDPESPDRITFDLDPSPETEWKQIVEAARELRRRLHDLGLSVFVKTTGGRGVHVVVPIRKGSTWDEVEDFSRAIAQSMASANPDRYIATMSKEKRSGKVFIDYLRNARAASAVAPYSPRAREGAPVSTPISWKELSRMRPDRFTVKNIPARLKKPDPWADFEASRCRLTAAMRKKAGSL